MTQVKRAFSNRTLLCHYWSDSTITLAWIKQSPHQLKTFVANRVAEIQTSTSGCSWRHVRSNDNPADIASRGVDAAELINNNLWWLGPPWLVFDPIGWPGSQATEIELTDTDKHEIEAEKKAPLIGKIKIENFWIANLKIVCCYGICDEIR